MKTPILDKLDRKIIHALYLDGRVPFRKLAQVFDVSEQTIARRYRLLQESRTVRVVGQLNSQRLGRSDWAVRARCTPDAAIAVANALAQRPDTAWVQLLSGGTEVFSTVRNHDDDSRTALLLEELPTSRHIVSLEAYYLLHLFVARSAPGAVAVLSPEEIEQLRRPLSEPAGRGQSTLRDQDWPLLQALATDGRATYQSLAARTHWHHSSVRRRVEELQADGVLYFEADIDIRAIGISSRAMLWLSVVPAKLLAVGTALAQESEVPFAGATTGSANLIASVTCRDDYALFEFLTQKIAALDGVTRVETAPVIRSIKQHGPLQPAT